MRNRKLAAILGAWLGACDPNSHSACYRKELCLQLAISSSSLCGVSHTCACRALSDSSMSQSIIPGSLIVPIEPVCFFIIYFPATLSAYVSYENVSQVFPPHFLGHACRCKINHLRSYTRVSKTSSCIHPLGLSFKVLTVTCLRNWAHRQGPYWHVAP